MSVISREAIDLLEALGIIVKGQNIIDVKIIMPANDIVRAEITRWVEIPDKEKLIKVLSKYRLELVKTEEIEEKSKE